MVWKVKFDKLAEKDLNKLDKQIAVRILKFLNERIAKLENPRPLGESLKGQFEKYCKYGVGDYRIICNILDNTLTIIVVRVVNRKSVYH
ncbi:MAG: mRNA interferase RelE/StbE [Pseudomonadota bacterium]|nr:mRNA interferase RelE/StbE [Pseudomonadota bacterium]